MSPPLKFYDQYAPHLRSRIYLSYELHMNQHLVVQILRNCIIQTLCFAYY